MIFRSRVVPALLVVLSLFALPAAASAGVLYEVNSTGDQPDVNLGVNGCETSVGSCTLRAAIEEANESAGADTINFNTTVFQGQLVDTVVISGTFPTIEDPVTIDGTPSGQCTTEAGDAGPCAGVEKSGGGFGLTVDADSVTIEGLSVTGALTGIDVINGSTDFTALGDWVGVNLKGEVVANNTGIFLDPGSDEAVIGGTEEAERNVISGNNNEGLDLEGASKAKILGNYIGVLPDGTTGAGNAKGIEITNSTAGLGTPAVENEVGVTLTGEQAATPPCNAGCNVISNSFSYGIDLHGNGSGANEAPATGPTTIHGNFIGLDAPGAAALANNLWGVYVGNADEVTIGGTEIGDENRITGGEIGIVAGVGNSDGAANLTIRGNSIGVGAAGTALSPPNEGIFVSQEGIGSANLKAFIADNVIRNTGVGITQHSVGSLIAGNTITEAGTGILTYGSVIIEGSWITGNLIARSTHNGILIENGANTVSGNEVLESIEAGIRLQPSGPLAPGGNVIGSEEEAQENLISKNGGAAIEIEGPEATTDEIARNHGSENGGKFISLVAIEFEPNGPNGGIKPPIVTKATQAMAEGIGAQAGAKVRVFRKASAEPGELESFLAETTADGLGNWSVTFPASIPAGTLVTATQTSLAGGTSELFMPPVAAESTGGGGEEEGGGGGGGSGGGGSNNGGGNNSGGNGNAKDKTPPDTKIVKGPPKKTHKRTAKFKFTSTEAGSTFQCKMDRKPFKACSSPKKYKKLKPGKHVFKVRAIDKAGNVDPTPAKRAFTVLR
ncbi:MAG TPA: NosD domain-containing protein [Solirubrobacterales bacterium]|nr:NosD domain-containing protein [Solirubrobacterales bacterium]